jgi:hypothetical protein
MGNKLIFDVSLNIKPQNICLKVKSNMKIGELRAMISQNVNIPLEDLIIQIAG